MRQHNLFYIQIGIIIVFLINSFIAIAVSSVLPLGVRMFTTNSDSMAPTVKSTDLFITRQNPKYSYQQGDIISFYVYKSNPVEIRTHRIYQLGGNVYITKGDANEVIDPDYVRPRLVIGKVVSVIPLVGSYAKFIKTDIGTLCAIIFPALLIIGYHLLMILKISDKGGKGNKGNKGRGNR